MTEETPRLSSRTEAELAIAETVRKFISEKFPELKDTTIDFDIAKIILDNDPLRKRLGGDAGEEWVYTQTPEFFDVIKNKQGQFIPQFPHKEDNDLVMIIYHTQSALYLATEELEEDLFGEDYELWPKFTRFTYDEYDMSIEFKEMETNYIPTDEHLEKLWKHGFFGLFVCYTDGSERVYSKDRPRNDNYTKEPRLIKV